MQTANVMFLQLDTAGRVERINTAAEEITGYSRVEVEGRNWFETLVPRERYPYVWEQFTRLLQSGQLPSTFENPVLTKQGEERQILWKNNVLRDGDRTVGTISFGIDISERKRAEAERERLFKEVQEGRERLQTLSDQSFVAQETERRSLARELHDEIGQTLTAVQTNLQALQLSSDPSVFAARLGDSMRITDHALQQVRELSLDLRPAMLDDLGLIPALEWYIAREAERSGLKMQFNTQPDHIRLTSTVETACFRVTQAALTNVVRHAQARYVWVGLQQEGAEIVLTIRDDGVGFDVPRALERAAHGQSLGLLSMQERVRLAGGRLDIQSAAKRGTTIHARFPLAATAAADVAQAEIP